MARQATGPAIYDAYTAHHHLRAVAGHGAVAGVFLLNEYVAVRGLGATRWHVLALLLAPALAQFVAVVFNPADPRYVRRPFRFLGLPAYLLLLLPALVMIPWSPTGFVVLLAATTVVQALLIPVQNGLLARNYAEATRGRRFGRAVAVQAAMIIAVSIPAGWLLDRLPGAWRWLYVLAALAGVWEVLNWSRMRRRRPRPPPVGLIEHGSPWRVLRHDRTFLAFEACFMVYGLGFLMLQPVLPLYLVDELGVGYGEVGLARGAIFWLAMILVASLAGRLGDRIGILRLGAIGYALLAFFPLGLLLVPGVKGLYGSFAIYGIAMAAVNVAWNLGPIALARGRDPLPYLNAHVALVGVRALVGMVAGTTIHALAGARPVFVTCVVLEVIAAIGMYLTARASGRTWRVQGPAGETPAAP